MFSLSGMFLLYAANTKADVNCDVTCDGMASLAVVFFFLGGVLGMGVSMGFVPPLSKLIRKDD